MRLQTHLQLLAISACLSIFSCSNLPDSLSVPDFNLSATIPLLDTTCTLQQFLGSNTPLVRDPISGNLAISKTFDLPSVHLGDSLRIQSVAVQFSSSLNSDVDFVNRLCVLNDTHLGVEEFDPTLPKEGDRSIGEVDRELNIPVAMPNEVQNVQFSSGNLLITLNNNLPVDIDLGVPAGASSVGVLLITPGSPIVFAPITNSQHHLQRRGGSKSSAQFRLPLTGSTLNSQSVIVFRAKSPGTNGAAVHYTRDNNFTLSFTRESIGIDNARARLGPQDLLFSFDALLPAGTQITDGIIEEFASELQITNDFPLAGNAVISFPQIINLNTKKALMQQFRLERNSSVPLRISSNGDRFRCVPDSSDRLVGGTMTKLHGTCRIHTDAAQKVEDFQSTQKFSVLGTVSPIRFSSVSGFNAGTTAVHFSSVNDITSSDLGGIQFQSISVEHVDLLLSLVNDADLRCVFEGTSTLFDVNGNELVTTSIDPTVLLPRATTVSQLHWTDLHLKAMPARVKVEGNIRSENSQPFTLSKGNMISGSLTLSMPIAFRVTKGEYKSSQTLDLGADVRSGAKHIEVADLLVEAHNTIPAQVGVTIRFYDSLSTEVLRIPASPTLLLKPGHDGVMAKSFTHFTIAAADIPHLIAARRYEVSIAFDTEGDRYAQFKSTDAVQLRMRLQCSANTH